jgi:hypothetical protein
VTEAVDSTYLKYTKAGEEILEGYVLNEVKESVMMGAKECQGVGDEVRVI